MCEMNPGENTKMRDEGIQEFPGVFEKSNSGMVRSGYRFLKVLIIKEMSCWTFNGTFHKSIGGCCFCCEN